MMPTTYLACDLPNPRQRRSATQTATVLSPLGGVGGASPPENRAHKEVLRHILLGSPGAIRQTIYLLHSLRYSETALWTPLAPVQGQLLITSEQGEMMSLLRRSL